MKQSGRIETGCENAKIKPGDLVRLLQPFRPERYCIKQYAFAIVAGVVTDGRSSNRQSLLDSKQAAGQQPELDELVVYLYEPDSSTTYVDQFGMQALFSFNSDEVELP